MTKPASNYDLQMDMAKEIFLRYDQDRIIQKYHLQADAQWMYLTYLNIPCRIGRTTGKVEEFRQNGWQTCREYNTVMTVYDLLCYHQGDSAPVLLGQWCTAGTFVVSGVTKTETFTKKYAKVFDRQQNKLKMACEALGGTLQSSLAGEDITCRFAVTPFFSVVLQFWAGDEEFPPKLLILWDRNTLAFLHYETTFYLQGDILDRLQNAINE